MAQSDKVKTMVRPDGTVRIPDPIYTALGLKPGAELDWQLEAGHAVVQSTAQPIALARRIRARAKSWKIDPAFNQKLNEDERVRELANDRRERQA
jgi:antitoxin component of MazEF toxin-antitoxin module